MTALSDHLAHISDQGSCGCIGQHEARGNAALAADVNPSSQPQISVDSFDLNASRIGVRNDYRLGYRRGRVVLGRHPGLAVEGEAS